MKLCIGHSGGIQWGLRSLFWLVCVCQQSGRLASWPVWYQWNWGSSPTPSFQWYLSMMLSGLLQISWPLDAASWINDLLPWVQEKDLTTLNFVQAYPVLIRDVSVWGEGGVAEIQFTYRWRPFTPSPKLDGSMSLIRSCDLLEAPPPKLSHDSLRLLYKSWGSLDFPQKLLGSWSSNKGWFGCLWNSTWLLLQRLGATTG